MSEASAAPGLVSRAAGRALGLFALAAILALGAAALLRLPLALFALGYMVLAMERVIAADGRILAAGLPGQDALARAIALALALAVLVGLPLALLAAGGPLALAGAFGLLAAPMLAALGLAGTAAGGPVTLCFRPRAAWRAVARRLDGRPLLPTAARFLARRAAKAARATAGVWMRGVRCFLGALCLLALPSFLLALGWTLGWVLSFEREGEFAAFCVALALIGAAGVGWASLRLPMATARFAAQGGGRLGAFLEPGESRRAAAAAPGLHGLVLLATLLLMLPLHVLRIPRLEPQAAWATALAYFALVLAAKLLWAKAYAASARGVHQGRPWLFSRGFGRLAAAAAGLLAAALAVMAPFVSWRGPWGFFDHFAYLLPLPF